MAVILVVDDESSIVETIEELLSWEGHQVVTASDGVRALETLERAHPPIDIVLVDLMMPVMDGIAALREIRSRRRLASLRVILMTGAPASVPHRERIYDALLVKPFSAEQLREAITARTKAPPPA